MYVMQNILIGSVVMLIYYIGKMRGRREAGVDIPVDMLLFCPECNAQHVDKPNPDIDWQNPPHKSHLCLECGWIWRVADVYTNGVIMTRTNGKNDHSPYPSPLRGKVPICARCSSPAHHVSDCDQ